MTHLHGIYSFSMNLINAKKNLFGGCVVESAALPENPDEFTARLKYSLEIWKAEGVKVVWLEVSREKAQLIPLCVAAGFVFHHAAENVLQMTLTLIPGSTIPPYATHYAGAGGVVIDDKRRLLVVSERYKQMPGRRLKLPGGALKEGEHIAAAAVPKQMGNYICSTTSDIFSAPTVPRQYQAACLCADSCRQRDISQYHP